ncbi:hypothetical protein, partial [Nocardia seriolae]|uniref:hypothetical protein n=1 Tax=Nocardia seriolae TaxID=37332 RepID=UPI001E56A5EE
PNRKRPRPFPGDTAFIANSYVGNEIRVRVHLLPHAVFGVMNLNWGVALVRNVFRVGLLAATLVSLGVAASGTGFAVDSGSAGSPAPKPPKLRSCRAA